MGMFDLYRSTVNCPSTYGDLENENIKDNVINNWYSNPNTYKVTRNIENVSYDVIIGDYNTKSNIVGVKNFLSYPYDESKFYIGDYVKWNLNNKDTSWLILSLDTQLLYNVNGMIQECNNILKWKDLSGNIKSYDCVIPNKVNSTTFDYSAYMTNANADIFVLVQLNEDTALIKEGIRFIFDGQVFKTSAYNNMVGGVLTLYLTLDAESEKDDFVNSIADYYDDSYILNILQSDFENVIGSSGTLNYVLKLEDKVVNSDIVWESSNSNILTIDDDGNYNMIADGDVVVTCKMFDNENVNDTINIVVSVTPSIVKQVIISPDITEIYEGSTQSYEVFKYTNNVEDSDTFTIVDTGADNENYKLTIVSGNEFTIENIKKTTTKLNIECISDIDFTSSNIEILLKGGW